MRGRPGKVNAFSARAALAGASTSERNLLIVKVLLRLHEGRSSANLLALREDVYYHNIL